jgi:hypothetical protein
VALVAALMLWRLTPRPHETAPLRPRVLLVCVCVTQFFAWQAAWLIASSG